MADGSTIMLDTGGPYNASNKQVRSLRKLSRRRSTAAVLLCLPLLVLVIGLEVYPTFYALLLSMMNRKMTEYVGLDNFIFMISRDSFQLVVFQSCLFAVTAVIMKAFLGFILAHLMHNIRGRNQRIWRGLLLIPWVIPLALSTLTWFWLFDPSYSAFNWTLNSFGLDPIPFLGTTWNARIAVIVVNTWFGAPFFMIMYLAALKSVSEQLYEAAAIDGAGSWQKLIFITLPMMRNIIMITVLFSLIVTFADFDIVRILTNGGPQDSTHLFATYAFTVGIQSGHIPRGASVSLFMFPILATLAFFVLRDVLKRNKEIAS
ncbi:MAG: sugar ABC transporter permease [Alphaproteobacteria bacterium]|nr:sugar ABC transporter permease [Alphaproteobacteria bacterium]